MTATDPGTDPGTGSTAVTPSVREEVFGAANRTVTVGIVLLISLVAFEAMGVGTAMPALVDDLGSVSSYAWPFVSFVAATVVGTVLGGRWCDQHGPRAMLLGAPVVFGLGLLVAGTSTTMAQVLAGRTLQGLGAGAQGVAVYVLIALVYSPAARPAVFGLISSAWVLPSLVGPPVAGFLTDQLSWHWVFLALIPVVVLALLLLLPAAPRMTAPETPPVVRRGLASGAVAAAVGVAALSWAGQHPSGLGVLVAVVSLALLVVALPRLVPAGTLAASTGVGATVVSRALVAGAFFTANSYLPLMLTRTHGWSLTAAGLPLIAGSLGWSASAAWQGRRTDLSRTVLLRWGFVLVGLGIAMLLAVAPAGGIAWLAFPALTVAGTGMGLSFSSISFLLLHHSASADVGFNASSAQLSDQLSQAFFVGLGGALLALLSVPAHALPLLLVVLVLLAALGALVAGRTARD